MPRIKTFVKVSGDEFKNPKFLKWVAGLSKESYVVICVGGGTQINEEFKRRGFPIKKKGPLGRETETFKQLQVARDVLERNAAELEDLLAEKGIHVRVELPFKDIGGVLCPLDGDLMVQAAYIGYDRLFVITTQERLESKTEAFAGLPKVKVCAFV